MKFSLETLAIKKIIENSKYLFLFLPLLFLPVGNEFFEFPKYAVLLFVSVLFLLTFEFKELKFNSITLISFFIFIFVNIISSNQVFFKESFYGLDFMRQNSILFLISLFIFLVFYSHSKFPNNYLNKVESYFLVGVFISATLGVIQFLTKPLGLISNDWFFDGRIVSTLGHPNFLAAVLVIALILIERTNLPWVKSILLLCLILTFSKASIILYFLYVFLKYLRSLYSKERKMAITLILTSVLFLFFIFNGLFSNFYKETISDKPYMYQFQRFFLFLDPKELYTDLRFKIWEESFRAIADSPYFGYGRGQIIRVIEIPEFNDLSLSSTHNLYIDVALESGLIGLSVFLIFIISSLINSYRYDKYLFLIQLFIVFHGFLDITPVILWFLFIFISGISINKYNKNYLKQV